MPICTMRMSAYIVAFARSAASPAAMGSRRKCIRSAMEKSPTAMEQRCLIRSSGVSLPKVLRASCLLRLDMLYPSAVSAPRSIYVLSVVPSRRDDPSDILSLLEQFGALPSDDDHGMHVHHAVVLI
ncbi:MAG: hypothetical protein A4E31_01418 [Methanomassiliicoccales archaeon PtaU1.Bin030]|nr:MAG: hypothetical protein A4E31_01418 [Methanomassiliicoccales archaeon PtaU1.Bin030]